MEFERGRWFDYPGGIALLIRPIDGGRVLDLDEKRKRNELNNEQMLEELFRDSLLEWDGIAAGSNREEGLKVLFDDLKIRDFVLRQATSMFEQETKVLKEVIQILERKVLWKVFRRCDSQLKS